jgi:hypothetical protein
MELAVVHVLTERCADLEAKLQQYRDVYEIRFVCDDDGSEGSEGKYYLCQHRGRVRVEKTKLRVWVTSHDPSTSKKRLIRMHNTSIMCAELGTLGTHVNCELRFDNPNNPMIIFPSDEDEGIFYLRTIGSVDPITEGNARKIFRSIATHCPPKVIMYD